MFNRRTIVTKRWLRGLIQQYRNLKLLLEPSSMVMRKLMAIAKSSEVKSLANNSPLSEDILEQISTVASKPTSPKSNTALIIKMTNADLVAERTLRSADAATVYNVNSSLISAIPSELWSLILSFMQTRQAYFSTALSCTYLNGVVTRQMPIKMTTNIKLTKLGATNMHLYCDAYFSPNKELFALPGYDYSLPSWTYRINIHDYSGVIINRVVPPKPSHFVRPTFSRNLEWLLVYEYYSSTIQIWNLVTHVLVHRIQKVANKSHNGYSFILSYNENEFIAVIKQYRDNHILVRINAITGKVVMTYDINQPISFMLFCNKTSFICGSLKSDGMINLSKFDVLESKPINVITTPNTHANNPCINVRMLARRLNDEVIVIYTRQNYYSYNHRTNLFKRLMQLKHAIMDFDIMSEQYILYTKYSDYAKKIYFLELANMTGDPRMSWRAHVFNSSIKGFNLNQSFKQHSLDVHFEDKSFRYAVNYLEERPDRPALRLKM